MVIDKKNQEFRNKLIDELTLLKTAFNRTKVEKRSVDSLDRAIKHLKDVTYLPAFVDEDSPKLESKSTPFSWGYAIKDFLLEVDTSSSVQYPKSVKKALLLFSVEVTGEVDVTGHNFKDPFKSLEFNIVIEGQSRGAKQHIFSYHLDRDIKGAAPPHEIHPGYHFHYGGRKLKSYTEKNFGNSLILDMPRLMHYPMDFILGIDFITSNFTPDLWKGLRRDPSYVKALKTAQDRVLKPYFGALAQHFGFHINVTGSWPGKHILPQAV